MEIIHIILGKANPLRMNGVNKVVHQLATKQTSLGMKVEVWGITHNKNHDYPPRNFKTRLFDTSLNPFFVCEKLKAAILSKKSTAVFHIHGGFIPRFYSISKFMKENNTHFVFTPHGSYNSIAMNKSKFVKKIYFSLFERKVLESCDAIHCFGKSEINGLKSIAPNLNADLIPYGFEVSDERARNYERGQNFIVGYCGRIDIYTKGLDALLSGFAAFHEYVPGSELWIIGDGSDLTQLKAKAKQLKIEHAIAFWGACYGEVKAELLKNITVFAHPSRNEGLPTAVLEAASMGIPCLITEATNLGEQIDNFQAGEVITQTTDLDVKKGLLRLHDKIENGELPKMHYYARQMVHLGFDWEKLMGQYYTLYTKIWKAV